MIYQSKNMLKNTRGEDLMESNVKNIVEKVIKDVEVKNPGQNEFHQTIEEVLTSLIPVLEKNPA